MSVPAHPSLLRLPCDVVMSCSHGSLFAYGCSHTALVVTRKRD